MKRTVRIILTMFVLLVITSCSKIPETTTAAELPSTSLETTIKDFSEPEVTTTTTIQPKIFTTVPLFSDSVQATTVTEETFKENLTNSETTNNTSKKLDELTSIILKETSPSIVLGSKKEDNQKITTIKPRKKIKWITKKDDTISRAVLNVENIQQLPELSAGCEITSTAIALNYEGIEVSKMDLLSYLPIMEYPDKNDRWESPENVFVGNPKLTYYGCYSPVIVKTINNYFEDEEITSHEIIDLSGSSIEELCTQIDEFHPVIIWATISMKESYTGRSFWKLQDGSIFHWRSREHCVVLIGYDLDKKTVIISDPYDKRGTVEYDIELVQKRYEEMGEQALVIQKIPKKNKD